MKLKDNNNSYIEKKKYPKNTTVGTRSMEINMDSNIGGSNGNSDSDLAT